MAEPQPTNVTEGADPPDVVPANAEDRKAAAALSSLDAKGDDETSAPKKEVDLKALNDAMKNLGVGTAQNKADDAAGRQLGGPAPRKLLVKVEPADVALLVEQLDLSKTKATELLRAHEANVIKAMTAWVTGEA